MRTAPRSVLTWGGLSGEFVAGAAGAVGPAGGTGVGFDLLAFGVPFDGAVETLRDAGELADGRGAVADMGGADGGLAGADAVEPVLGVVGGFVEAGVAGAEGAFGEFGHGGLEFTAAADADFALGADEADHVAVGLGVIADDFDAVRVLEVLIRLAFVAFGHAEGGAGVVAAEGPLGDVVVVGTPVAVFAGAVFPEATPASAVVAKDACGGVGFERGRAEPLVVVEAGGDGFGGAELGGREGAEADVDAFDFADPAAADHLSGFEEGGVGALLGADLDDGAVAAFGGDHGLAFGDGEGHGLLDVDVFAGAHGGDGDGGVPVVGGDDDHAVDGGIVDDVFVVGGGGDVGETAASQVGFGVGEFVGFDVADVERLHAGDVGHGDEATHAFAVADEGEVDAAVGAGGAVKTEGLGPENGGGSEERGAEGRGVLEEGAARGERRGGELLHGG